MILLSTASFTLLLVGLAVQPALAHPYLIESDPEGFGQLQSAPDKVVISYSEPVEEGFSTIRVTDSSGERVDNEDTRFLEGDQSVLVVTLQSPLPDDVYTVNSRVLSQVDGHVVEYTYSFIVGAAETPLPRDDLVQSTQPAVFLPESLSRFPGLVGQVIIVGISFGSLFLWKSIDRIDNLRSSTNNARSIIDRRYTRLLLIGVLLVIASGYAMIFVQAESLGVGIGQAVGTKFGTTWLARMFFAFVALGLFFAIRPKHELRAIHHLPVLALGISLLATTTMMGHGAATTQSSAIVLDFIHNIVASVWIGGLIYLGFAAVPALKQLGIGLKSAIIALLVPRFSMITALALGIAAVTGPLLLWSLESNVNSLVITSYGKILISKLVFAGFMIVVGAYNQLGIHRKAVSVVRSYGGTEQVDVQKTFNKTLKVELGIGIALLMSVALLTNTSLPEGELPLQTLSEGGSAIDGVADGIDVQRRFVRTQFTDDAMVTLNIEPAKVGFNNITVSVTDLQGNVLSDLGAAQLKLTNLKRGIGPLISELSQSTDGTTYSGEATIGSVGRWTAEVLVERETALSIAAVFDMMVKPTLQELSFDLKEYEIPDSDSLPLFSLHNDGVIWISDTGKPRIWAFEIEDEEFTKYDLEGNLTTTLDLDSSGRVWFLDPVARSFGYLDPDENVERRWETPDRGLPVSLDVDFNDNVWITLLDTNTIVKFVPATETVVTFEPPTEESQPSAVMVDDFGNVWFTEAYAGKLGLLDSATSTIEEFVPPDEPMAEPFALIKDADGNIWIAEHIGPKVTRFDPRLQTFQSFSAIDEEALPYGMAIDDFENVWFAQHVTDNIGVLNPHSGNMIEVEVPTQTSFVQWLTKDDSGKIWFAEQRGNKIGSVSITQKPAGPLGQPTPAPEQLIDVRYADIAGPGISIAVILSSLFFVKSVYDQRRSVSVVRKSVL